MLLKIVNKITVEGFIYFTEICQYLPNICELLLDYNLICGYELTKLFCCLKYLPKLMIFGISENPIGDVGIISLSENLLFIRNLIYLNMESMNINIWYFNNNNYNNNNNIL